MVTAEGAAVDEFEHLDQGRLGLDGNDPSAQAAERGHAIANVRADVKHQITPSDKSTIQANP